ncbi:GNAT family N-acetyltransferase [Streptomyces sp. NPDC002138]|uniref:GNAT family N-acetyltransferase n=1 Tax=Streptomyces sp. NPDC002138 TaxID=3154410 RepID=UPI0033235818
MTWTFTEDLPAFVEAAGPALAADPLGNTQMLTTVDSLRRRGPNAFGAGTPYFAWWTGADGVVAAALLCTPPHPLLVGSLPAGALAALAAVLDTEPLLAGVAGFNARREDAEVLAAAWGRPADTAGQLRLFRLDTPVAPSPAPGGTSRLATTRDVPLLLDWLRAFAAEAETTSPTEPWVRDRLSYGGVLLWQDPAGTPVSLASFSRPQASTARVGPVYTPPADRGHGYAAGATHAATLAARTAGATEVLLFTDLTNPTSNRLYPRLGYTPLWDRTVTLARTTPAALQG